MIGMRRVTSLEHKRDKTTATTDTTHTKLHLPLIWASRVFIYYVIYLFEFAFDIFPDPSMVNIVKDSIGDGIRCPVKGKCTYDTNEHEGC